MADIKSSPERGHARTEHAWPLSRSFMSYRAGYLTPDLISGLTLAAIAIPEQMATARLGGFPPQLGFFAFMAGSLAFAVFGGSRVLSSGADSTITPIFAGTLAAIAATGSPHYMALASVLALMAGAILVFGGLFRLGWIANLLSVPVTLGFLTGIAVHIFVSQLPSVLGIAAPDGSTLAKFAALSTQLGAANPFTIAIGAGVLAMIIVAEQIDARIPAALIGVVAATAAVIMDGLEARGVAVLGDVSGALPMPTVPEIAIAQLLGLVPLAGIISMVIMVQTAATTRSFPSEPDEPPDVNRDFIGVGAGSILSGLLGAFPVNASPPRTAVVAQTGGRSQLAGLVAAAIVLALVVAGTALLRNVPQAALGGILFFVAFRIVRLRQIAAIYRTSLGEFALIVATMLAIVVLPIAQGVGLGIALSLLHGIWTMTQARIIIFERIPGTSIWWPKSTHFKGEREPGVVVVGFPAPLSFVNAEEFRRGIHHILHESDDKLQLVVLEATGIVEIDFTAAQMLTSVIRECHKENVAFAIARLESVRAQEAMARFGINETLGSDREFRSVEEAIRALASTDRTG